MTVPGDPDPGRRRGGPPPGARDPDPDAVSLAAATAAGVLLGARLGSLPEPMRARPGTAAWALAALSALAAALAATTLLAAARGSHDRRPTRDATAGVLALATLATGAAAAGLRAAAVHDGLLPALAGTPGTVEVHATVAEEPRPLRGGARSLTLSVDRVTAGDRAWRTRERATVVLPAAPAGGPPLAAGDRLRLRARPSPAPHPDRLGGHPPVTLRHPLLEARDPPRSRLLRASETVRAGLRRRAQETLPTEQAGLLTGMGLGDTSLLPVDLDQAFRAAGLTHLMAVSGENLAVVLAAGLGAATLLGAGRRPLAAIGSALVAGFVLLTRWEPSVLRAGVMAVLVLLGMAGGRGPGGRRALCLATTLLLLADPALAEQLGFQLSVAATAGVLWLGPAVARALPGRIPERFRSAAGITLGAQAAALPLIAATLGTATPAALPANLAGLPLAGPPMLLGAVAAAAEPVAPPLAALACRLAQPFLAGLIAVARWAAELPGASTTLTGPTRAVPTLLAVALTLAVRRRARRVAPRPAGRGPPTAGPREAPAAAGGPGGPPPPAATRR
ncbi:MAG TPA: ComEC/Rec2 family competence protein [Actinomycetes bacterium]|nr:ComEC/Rec2 family competence protein [Actinomycetes bacterium]